MGEGEQGISFASEQAPKKERLSEAKLGGLLAGIGNNEGKAILLALMGKGRVYSQDELHSLSMKAQGDQRSWNTAEGLQFSWCEHSLHPIGLVALEVIDREVNVQGYMKTAYGDREGTAFAGHLLAFSQRHPEVSLYKLFGSTSSPNTKNPSVEEVSDQEKSRSPLTRFRIFYELITHDGSMREIDMMASLHERYPQEYASNISASVESHLDQLGRSGLVQFDKVKENKSVSLYSFSSESRDEQPTSYRSESTHTQQAYELLKENPDSQFTIDQFFDVYVRRYLPQVQMNEHKSRNLKSRISNILSHLSKEGYVIKGQFDKSKRSEISVTEKQRVVLTELVTILDRFSDLNEAYIDQGIRFAKEIASDPQQVFALMEKAKTASPHANRLDQGATFQLIKVVVKSGSHSSREIQQALEDRYNKKLTKNRIQAIINRFSNDVGLRVTTVNNVNYYSIDSEEAQEAVRADSQD